MVPANLTVNELADWLADPSRARPVLLDVREPWETDICRITGAQLTPLQQVPQAVAALDPQVPVVCICHHGTRSAHAALFLQRQGVDQVFNLAGGIDAWARQVDRAMPTY
jgi:rhodanese-related sulfurtransferase